MTRTAKGVLIAGASALLAAAVARTTIGNAGGGEPAPAASPSARRAPRLVDVGADQCIPCRAMAPILERLRADLAGRIDVVFVDAWKAPEEARRYGVRMIPTQIFFAADGRELARHEGFMSREEILARWKALGVEP